MSQKKTNNGIRYSTDVRVNILKKYFTFISILISWYVIRPALKRFIKNQFFAPRSYTISDIEEKYLEKGEPFEIMVHDQKVQYWKWGKGQSIIFAHGWNGRGIQFLSFFNEIIKSGYSVITFDGPGHGQSGGKTSSYFQMTDALRAIVKHIKPENIQGLVGHSFGAAAIINTLSKEKCQIPAVLIAPALKIKELLDSTFLNAGMPKSILYGMIADYEKMYNYNLEKDNPVNLLSTFNLQALIVNDSEDLVTPLSVSSEIADQYDSIELFRTDGLGHKRVLTDKSVLNKTINYFNNHRHVNSLK